MGYAVNMKLPSHTVSLKAQLSLCTLFAGKRAADQKRSRPAEAKQVC